MKISCKKNKKLMDSITKGHKEKNSIRIIPIKKFWECLTDRKGLAAAVLDLFSSLEPRA